MDELLTKLGVTQCFWCVMSNVCEELRIAGSSREGITFWELLRLSPWKMAVNFPELSWGFGSYLWLAGRIVVHQVVSPHLFYFFVKWDKVQIICTHLTWSNYSHWTMMPTWVLQCWALYLLLEKFKLERTVDFLIISDSLYILS